MKLSYHTWRDHRNPLKKRRRRRRRYRHDVIRGAFILFAFEVARFKRRNFSVASKTRSEMKPKRFSEDISIDFQVTRVYS